MTNKRMIQRDQTTTVVEEKGVAELRARLAVQVKDQTLDDKTRIRNIEDKLSIILTRFDATLVHYEDLTKAYDRLVTKFEFHPFKVMVWGQCVFMLAVVLILVGTR